VAFVEDELVAGAFVIGAAVWLMLELDVLGTGEVEVVGVAGVLGGVVLPAVESTNRTDMNNINTLHKLMKKSSITIDIVRSSSFEFLRGC
jgi:hypothetical protein